MGATTIPRWFPPFCVAVPFSAIVTGLSLSNNVPVPLGLVIGVAWALVIGVLATWIRTRKPTLSASLEDALVAVGAVAMAFSGCGGLMAILMVRGALSSSSLTPETLVGMYLPTIPYYIIANTPMEWLVVPGLLFLGWRAGKRRILIVIAAGLFFVLRVWSYLVFVPERLGFAETARSAVPYTAAERRQAYSDLQVDDPRWILVLVIFGVFLLATHFPRLRDVELRPSRMSS